MFMSWICILISYFIEYIVTAPSLPNKLIVVSIPTERVSTDRPPPPYSPTTRPCQGPQCQPRPNLVGPIVGSIGGILAIAIIGIFIVWFYYKRKYKKTEEVPKQVEPKYIEQPPLYTGTLSTTDDSSRYYGTSPSRNNSINSHLYEKINYNELS